MSGETVGAHSTPKEFTYSLGVCSPARVGVSLVVELEDPLEDDYPTDPHARGIKDGFDGVLDPVKEFDGVLDPFADVTPADRGQGEKGNGN